MDDRVYATDGQAKSIADLRATAVSLVTATKNSCLEVTPSSDVYKPYKKRVQAAYEKIVAFIQGLNSAEDFVEFYAGRLATTPADFPKTPVVEAYNGNEPAPFLSWVYNRDTSSWEPPVPYPDYDKLYSWDEAVGNWVEDN